MNAEFSKPVVCCGLSPTVQRTLFFAQPVCRGAVVRATRCITTASGKAVNVARMVAQLGADSCLVHPLAGETGLLVESLLNADSVRQSVHWLGSGLTRTCTTVIDGETTELVEEAPRIGSTDLRSIEAMLDIALGGARLLCLSGSTPGGIDEGWYAGWVERANDLGVPTLVDAQRGPLIHCLPKHPWLVKPNRTEAIATLGLEPNSSARDVALALQDAGARHALVSDGPGAAVFAGPDGCKKVVPQPVDAVNPIGSGDALAAGVAAAFAQGIEDWNDLLRHGFAAAAANCLSATSGTLDPADAKRFRETVEIIDM